MDDAVEFDAAMAAAMGFSSFGTKPSAKRRKFNSSNDAVVATPTLSASSSQQQRQPQNQGRGANAIPLGGRPAAALLPAMQNTDEILLEVDGDGVQEEEDDPEPQYIDTSRPVVPVEGFPAPANAAIHVKDDGTKGTPASLGRGHRPWDNGRGSDRSSHRAGDRRGGSKPWWQDYFDPTANMNPWEKLEKENSLKPLNNDWLTWEESKARWEALQTAGDQNVGDHVSV
jgi:hypothetical protein